MEKIRIVIADDNKWGCDLLKNTLDKYEDIEILGIANDDEKEIQMIDNLKPEIVITDLMRNKKNTGLEIIRDYSKKENSPNFLIISGGIPSNDIFELRNVVGYMQKPNFKYDDVYIKLREIKDKILCYKDERCKRKTKFFEI